MAGPAPRSPAGRTRRALRCLLASCAALPLAAQDAPAVSPVELLQRWLAERDSPGQYEPFMQYRAAAMADAAMACVDPLTNAMREFAAAAAPQLDDAAVDALFAGVRTRRESFGATHGFLPWLLLVAKCRPDDLRAQLCLWEAWAGAPDGIRDAAAARAALERVQQAVADEDRSAAAATALAGFAAELAAFGVPDVAAAWLPDQLAAGAELFGQQQALPPGWLIGRRLGELEREFAAAVRGEGERDLLEVILTMQQVSPRDPTYALLYVLVADSGGRSGKDAARLQSEFKRAWQALPASGPLSQASVLARLGRFGVTAACAQLGLEWNDDPIALLNVKKGARAWLFPTADGIASARKRLGDGQDPKIAEYRAKAEEYERQRDFWQRRADGARNGTQRKTDWQQKANDYRSKRDDMKKRADDREARLEEQKVTMQVLEAAEQRLRDFRVAAAGG